MKKIKYEFYTKEEMADIGKNTGFFFVETSNGDDFIISKNDLADFIVQETIRCNQSVNMEVYVPNADIDEPILTTYGWYLNKVNPVLRSEIIDRLVKLQTNKAVPRDVKIFDNEIFSEMNIEEFGDEEGKSLQYDKFFKKYYEPEEELELE